MEAIVATRVQILNQAVCILYSANTAEKSMNSNIFIPFIRK